MKAKAKNRRGNGAKLNGGVSPDVGKQTQFQPGNPGGGRPRSAKFSDAVKLLAVEVSERKKYVGLSNAEALAAYCFDRAMKGSARHAEMFLGYAEGKPKQGVEMSGGLNMSYTETLTKARQRMAELNEKRRAVLSPEERMIHEALEAKMRASGPGMAEQIISSLEDKVSAEIMAEPGPEAVAEAERVINESLATGYLGRLVEKSNGHTDPQTARIAAAMPAEQPKSVHEVARSLVGIEEESAAETPKQKPRIRVEL
jgi:hypothetical protein